MEEIGPNREETPLPSPGQTQLQAAAWARLKAAMEQGHAIGAGRLDRDAAHERRAAVS